MKSYSEEMEEQLEPRPEKRATSGPLVCRSEFFPEPTAHEMYVRDRIPRGAHYDSADDGPETQEGYLDWVVEVLFNVGVAGAYEVLESAVDSYFSKVEQYWLDCHSHQFDSSEIEILRHSKE